jgi:hypothetical protein
MSESEAEFRSNLEDLECFIEFLSPLQGTSVVDSAQHIDFDEFVGSLLVLISECTLTPTLPTLVLSTI